MGWTTPGAETTAALKSLAEAPSQPVIATAILESMVSAAIQTGLWTADQRSAALLAELSAPGRTLVFCDDTDIEGKQVAGLEPDLRILLAIQMRSDTYAELDAAIAQGLVLYGVDEFHATDIATGNGAWRGRDSQERAQALAFLAAQAARHVTRAGGVWLPKGQYGMLRHQAEGIGTVSAGFKHGLKRALVRSVVERLAAGSRPAMMWMDQDKSQSGATVEHWPEATFLVGGGPVIAPSHLVAGLQLADLVIWAAQRVMKRRRDFDRGNAGAFEMIARDVLAALPSKIEDLRGDQSLADWAP